MRIAVAGMWHQGPVTAACLASAGHDVTAIDEDAVVIEGLRAGRMPVAEPGLAELTAKQLEAGRLRFVTSFEDAAVHDADVVWVAFDTPVTESDAGQVDFVHERARRLLECMRDGAVLLVSAQMPVGSVAWLEREVRGRKLHFACAPENLRLGKALEVFLTPDRVVVGVRNAAARAALEGVWKPFTDRIEWMSVESAEMTKHAINGFLAASICFINEIALLCEYTGADALEVERGLKTDARIGARAYLHAGSAFAGGTLGRDVAFLRGLGRLALMDGIQESNERHKTWLQQRMGEAFPSLEGRTMALFGLTYKPQTNTLRRSLAVEGAQWLHAQGARVQAFDPQIRELPAELKPVIKLRPNMDAALHGAEALVVMTPWPEFQAVDASLAPPVVFDAERFLEATLARRAGTRYFSIGRFARYT